MYVQCECCLVDLNNSFTLNAVPNSLLVFIYHSIQLFIVRNFHNEYRVGWLVCLFICLHLHRLYEYACLFVSRCILYLSLLTHRPVFNYSLSYLKINYYLSPTASEWTRCQLCNGIASILSCLEIVYKSYG